MTLTVIVASFAVLGFTGIRIYQTAPPIPERVVATDGREIVGQDEIANGQNVWQSMGGMEMGSIWGHGSYVAPDWTADWLHRESMFILDRWSMDANGKPYAEINAEAQAALRARLANRAKENRYDPATRTLTIDDERADAFAANHEHYTRIFANGRADYAIRRGTLSDPTQARQLSAFFFWSSWAAAAQRPGDTVSYTNNWPHEPLVGNRPTGDTVVWTGVSILFLLAGIGGMATWLATRKREDDEATVAPPATDPLLEASVTPSQRAVMKYFWTTGALLLLQNSARHRHRTLRRRRLGVLRHPSRSRPSVCRRPDVAPPARDLLDRDGMACDGSLCWTGRRSRTEVPEARRRRSLRRAARRGSRLDDWRVAQRHGQARGR